MEQKMAYNPQSLQDRRSLGQSLISTLSEKGFTLSNPDGVGESIYHFPLKRNGAETGFNIVIYTSIVNGVARGDGEDAIRVTLEWRDTPISKTTRVNRTGEIGEIVERTLQRGRDLFSSLPKVSYCNTCRAPKAVSKAGNLYCAARCWIK
jgi:hypothetical protein